MEKRKLPRGTWTVISGVLHAVIFIGLLAAWIGYSSHRRQVNAECDIRCRKMKYPAGEMVPWMKHDVCVCWPPSAEPATHFLLKRAED